MSDLTQLFTLALTIREKAYVPYSHFAVGAAIFDELGQAFAGCNVENVSYPCGTCAEAGAIAAMVAGGGSKIKDIVVVADAQNLISPCGTCLQRIFEFSTPNTLVHLANLDGIQKTFKITELLPVSFDEKALREK